MCNNHTPNHQLHAYTPQQAADDLRSIFRKLQLQQGEWWARTVCQDIEDALAAIEEWDDETRSE